MDVSKTLGFENKVSKIIETKTISDPLLELTFRFDGFNEDLVDIYYWHLNFAYYTGKGYTPLKLEDYHYFSENSQFGATFRQIKGGSIKAFQENLAQLVQLIKVHMVPLLKEVKQADFYKRWFDKIVKNDKIVQELKEKGVDNNDPRLMKARSERNEAVNHIKDKWVNEVDGGRMWQINRPAREQGLDFAILPQLFFGSNLDDPFEKKKSIKEQLDEDIYPIDVPTGAKEQVARFMYRFYTWLPTAIKDTEVSFRIKVSALKQFYAQLQMYINFMKPLLIEISRKSEGFERGNFYSNFTTENPEFVNLFDFSYSFIKVLGVRNLGKQWRGKHELSDLEFSKFGLFVDKEDLKFGEYSGKSGFLRGVVETKSGNEDLKVEYNFYPTQNRNISEEEFLKIKPVKINKEDLKKYPIMEKDFYQKRRMQTINTPQGPKQVPYMRNTIEYKARAWNIYEIASYRQRLKEKNLELLETFVGELAVIKEDLVKYVNYFENDYDSDNFDDEKKEEKDKNSKNKGLNNFKVLVASPFEGVKELFFPLFSPFKFNTKKDKIKSVKDNDEHLIVKLSCVEDTWKVYTVNKKVHGYMQY